MSQLVPPPARAPAGVGVKLIEHDPDAERKVVAAALFPYTDVSLEELSGLDVDSSAVLDALIGDRANRRHRVPRALEQATYLFEITANFAAYRDLQRHRMLSQERQPLGTWLGYDVPPELAEYGFEGTMARALEAAGAAHRQQERALGTALAQYLVPLAYRMRWYFRVSLREVFHLCELRTTPQGHPDYRHIAQEMFRRVQEVHPRLAEYARFVDLSPGEELERRASERRIDRKLQALG
jgi:hypothetical protein